MKKTVNNCGRNCWNIDKCAMCDNFIPIEKCNKEIKQAQELFEKITFDL